MFARPVLIAAGLVAVAAAAQEPPGKNASIAQVQAELRKIESAQYRGGADALRLGYEELSRNHPSEPLPRVYVAWCSMVSDEAWNQLRAVMVLEQDFPWAHYGMGRVYVAWKMKDPAKTEFDAALKKAPGFWPAKVGLADVLRARGDDTAAAALYREVLKEADDAEAHAGLGLSLLALGKKDEARAELKRAVALWPDQPKALSALMKLAAEAKDPEALGVARKLADLKPKDRDAHRQLAELLLAAGNKPEAAKEYEKVMRLGNAGAPTVERLAGLYRELGDDAAEERVLDVLISLDTEHEGPLLRLAELKAKKKDTEGQAALLVEAEGRNPKNPQVHLRLAELRRSQGLLYQTLEQLRAAAALEGEHQPEAEQQAAELEKRFELPKKPAAGGVNGISWRVAKSLGDLYEKRRWKQRLKPGLLRMRVKVAADGKVEGVDVLTDEVGDPVLTGHAYFSLRDAAYPKAKREPVFEFELGEKKSKRGK